MAGNREWYMVCYDIREPARWRKAYKLLLGYGQRIQYSIFRCKLTKSGLEEMRWELTQVLDAEDSILIVGLCNNCIDRIPLINRPEEWSSDDPKYAIM